MTRSKTILMERKAFQQFPFGWSLTGQSVLRILYSMNRFLCKNKRHVSFWFFLRLCSCCRAAAHAVAGNEAKRRRKPLHHWSRLHCAAVREKTTGEDWPSNDSSFPSWRCEERDALPLPEVRKKSRWWLHNTLVSFQNLSIAILMVLFQVQYCFPLKYEVKSDLKQWVWWDKQTSKAVFGIDKGW